MTDARCSGGIDAVSARRPPRNAMPNPSPATIEPARYPAPEPAVVAATIVNVPIARAIEPTLAPIHGAVRPKTSCENAADAVSATMPMLATITSDDPKRCAPSCGPSEKKRPPIDHDESTASAARTNGRRTTDGTLGR